MQSSGRIQGGEKKKKRRNNQDGVKIGKIFVYTTLFLLATVIFFPIIFAVGGAFMNRWELEEYLGPVLGGTDEWRHGSSCRKRRRCSRLSRS